MVDYEETGRRVEVISSKGCSRLFADDNNLPSTSTSSFSFRGLKSLEPASPSSARILSNGPFSGLILCVTGLSKEARKQVMDATESLGGEYSPHLHPKCTHLIVQSFHGAKFEHALKHGSKNGLYVVTLGWFVDSVKRNVRLSESLYNIKFVKDNGAPVHFQELEPNRRTVSSSLQGNSFYIDEQVSTELKDKVVEAVSSEGANLVEKWFVGCNATHIVCEGPSIRKYLGHSSTLVTPLWVLKTVKEKRLQRLVHLSSDLARETGTVLDIFQNGNFKQEINENTCIQNTSKAVNKVSYQERQKIANMAKDGVRQRRQRCMQTCQTPIRPITPTSLLNSICWSISESTSKASIYTDASSVDEHSSLLFDGKEEAKELELESSFVNMSRPLTESEKSELILKSHFLTILFPVDRFSEMGPRSRTYFSDKGFTCLQVLEYIYVFYQENMSGEEIEIAIHCDSRHGDRLRLMYSKETIENGYVAFKRIDYMGSRRSFEMLKRVTGDNNSNVYELLIRA